MKGMQATGLRPVRCWSELCLLLLTGCSPSLIKTAGVTAMVPATDRIKYADSLSIAACKLACIKAESCLSIDFKGTKDAEECFTVSSVPTDVPFTPEFDHYDLLRDPCGMYISYRSRVGSCNIYAYAITLLFLKVEIV
jgi:hypothetical protein